MQTQTNPLSGPIPSAVAPRPSAGWKPGLDAPCHNEIFASGRDGGGSGLALALALDAIRSADCGPLAEVADQRAVLWVQDRAAIRLAGRPYRPGLPVELRHRLIHVVAEKPEDLLFALEEGLRCRDLACVIGEVAGNPKTFNFTVSRRLSLNAEKHGVPLWLVRVDARHDLSSARMRWDVRSAPSPVSRWNAAAPGLPSWNAELFRARAHPPGQWILRDDGYSLVAARSIANDVAPDHVDLARPTVGRSLAALQ